MEVTRCLIMITMLVSLQFALTYCDVIVQPGYEKKSSNPVKSESPVANQPRQSTLIEEIQRYNNLQRVLQGQILQLINQRQVQQLQGMPQGIVGYPLSPMVGSHLYPLSRPYYSTANLHSLTPTGLRGLNVRGYGIRRSPHLHREASPEETNADESDVAKSTRNKSGLDGGLEQVHDVAAEPSVEESKIHEVVELPVSENNAVDDRTKKKLLESRQIGQPDDIIVGSPLDRIHYNQYDNQDQHHPINSGRISSRILNTDGAVGAIIDTEEPIGKIFRNTENKDSMASMTRYQDQGTNQKGQSIEAASDWKMDKARSNDQEIAGKSWNEEQQNSGLTSTSSIKTSQSPKAASNERQSQQTAASNLATNDVMKNKIWMIAPRTFHSTTFQHQSYPPSSRPGYQSDFQPGYQAGYQPNYQPNYQLGYQPNYQPGYQPIYQNNYGNPPIGNNQPLYGNGGSTSTSYASSGPSGSTASASSSSKNNNNNSYRSSYVSNPFVSWLSYSTPKFVDQFGRTILSASPSNSNTMIANSNLKNLHETQFVRFYQQPRYWY